MTRRTKIQTREDQRHCSKCDRILDIKEFTYINRKTGKRRHNCRDCRNQSRWFMHRVKFEYDELLQNQGGKCAICKIDNDKSRLSIDHNHKTLEIRGLLCHECNSGIAYFDENTKYLISAAIYLIGGRDEKQFSLADTDPNFDLEHYGRISKLCTQTGELQGVSLPSRALDEGVELEATGQITD